MNAYCMIELLELLVLIILLLVESFGVASAVDDFSRKTSKQCKNIFPNSFCIKLC